MITPLINFAQRWTFLLCLLFPLQWSVAQFVDLTAEIEITDWSAKEANARRWPVRCVVGTNAWQMDGEFSMNSRVTYLFTGTNIIEHSVVTKEIPAEFLKKLSSIGPFVTSPPVGEQYTHLVWSVDGNPGLPVRKADRLTLLGRIGWLAFCSGPCLKREGRQIYPPSDQWKELIDAPSGFPDRTTVFGDPLGLPRSVNLYTTNGQPVLQYRVTASTNLLGWEFPLEFYLAQYRPACLPDSQQFGTNGWELELTAKGKVTAIGIGTKLQTPQEMEKAAQQ